MVIHKTPCPPGLATGFRVANVVDALRFRPVFPAAFLVCCLMMSGCSPRPSAPELQYDDQSVAEIREQLDQLANEAP